MDDKKLKKKLHLQRALELYQETTVKKEVTIQLLKELGLDFKQGSLKFENARKSVQKWLKEVDDNKVDLDFENESINETNQYENLEEIPLSALKPDGTIMSITEYCEHYDIPEDTVKSFKLVTHTGVARYNIASHNLQGNSFKIFYDKLLQEIKEIPNDLVSIRRPEIEEESYLLILDPADIHIGKLAESFDTGNEYNRNIAIKRTLEGVHGILEKVKGFPLDKILFIAGNDILHIDTPKRTTTSGTVQDTDGMWHSNFLLAKSLYIDVLKILLKVADVHVVFNPSNHDYTHGFFLMDVVKTYFRNVDNVTFDSDLKHRKYFRYYDNLIGSTHGDGAKEADLGPLMAHEAKEWSSCKHRYIYTHHVHHKTAKDRIGVTIEAVRSPSGTDRWHSDNGYTGVPKAIEGFLHSKTKGQIARITHVF